MAREVNILKSAYLRLAGALEQNTRVFSDAFQMADAQIHVMQRALNDFVKANGGKQGDSLLTADQGIDFSGYLMEYWACQSFSVFVQGLKDQSEERKAQRLADRQEQDVQIFGGA